VGCTIYSTLNNGIAITSPVAGAGGTVVGSPGYSPGRFDNGIVCVGGYAKFPTRLASAELVSNSAGTISLWVTPHFQPGSIGGRIALFSLYNDSGSHIVAWWDDNTLRFGFTEAGVGDAAEASPRTLQVAVPLLVALTWDGYDRSLFVQMITVAEQPQGAEFIPESLVLGVVEDAGGLSVNWSQLDGVLDNLKVEDIHRTGCSDLNRQGPVTRSYGAAFTRTLVDSTRSARMSSTSDDMRNCWLCGLGVSSDRSCWLVTGGYDCRNAALAALPGSWVGGWLSAPCSAELSGSLTAAGEAVADAAGFAPASGCAPDDRASWLTARGALSADKSCHVTSTGGVNTERTGWLLPVAGGTCGRSASLRSIAAAEGVRSAGLRSVAPGESVRASLMPVSLLALQSRPGAMPVSVLGSAARMALCESAVPVSRSHAWLCSDHTSSRSWLRVAEGWLIRAGAAAGIAVASGTPGDWRTLAAPQVIIASAKAHRAEGPSGDEWTGEFECTATGTAQTAPEEIAARFVASCCSALRRGTTATLAGPYAVAMQPVAPAGGAGKPQTRFRVGIKALVTPCGLLV
jgi:hypothetical protein